MFENFGRRKHGKWRCFKSAFNMQHFYLFKNQDGGNVGVYLLAEHPILNPHDDELLHVLPHSVVEFVSIYGQISIFQFLMVRLKDNGGSVTTYDWKFQFLMVRLKG